MASGWWTLTMTGAELNETDLEHIADMVKQGYTSGQLVQEDD